ncbi:MAG TPA: NHL repeat-containing protein, partial [Solirubrobacterales bacterium]|nr:NHL repeat-containing protein [Solirubrobacterales bacterium]
NLWVTDAGNHRVQKFNSKGEFLLKIEGSGTTEGKFSEPEDVAVDSKGNVWVADTYNNRVEKFSSSGTFIKMVGVGQLLEDQGIVVGPENKVYVANSESNKVVAFNEEGTKIGEWGKTGSGEGEFKGAAALAIDPTGIVWVTDIGNDRVEGFTQAGEYIGQFGAWGTAAGLFQFQWWDGIASDSEGNLFIADTKNNRIQKWNAGTVKAGVASTEVTIDGKVVDTSPVGCQTFNCTVARELTLTSSAYAVGNHSVVVKTKSEGGLTTTKTLPIEIQRDTTKPTLSLSTPLTEAPEGWVEQHRYAFSATATDPNGSGIKSLVLKVDGVPAESNKNGCPSGGCKASLSEAVNVADYTGGAHTAELIATDGAGNSTSKKWTLNVDPKGTIGDGEAARTLEAMEATSPVVVVGEGEEEESGEGIEGLIAGLELQEGEEGLESVGGGSPIVIAGTERGQPCTVGMQALSPKSGEHEEGPAFEEEVESGEVPPELEEKTGEGGEESVSFVPPGEPLAVTPTQSEGNSCQPALSNQVAAIESNSQSQADSITRPLFEGAVTFEAIRGPSAPEEYSWHVELEEEQELSLQDDQHAVISYPDGTIAVAITAEPAHDATGREVATTLSVSGDGTITLHIPYGKGDAEGKPFVYPILAGAGYEVGHEEVTITYPSPPEEGEEEVEATNGFGSLELITFGPSIPDAANSADQQAPPLAIQAMHRSFKFTYCWPHHIPGVLGPPGEFDPGFGGEGGDGGEKEQTVYNKIVLAASECHREDFHGIYWGVTVHGYYNFKVHHWVRVNPDQIGCNHWGEEQPMLDHCKMSNSLRVPGPVNVVGEFRFADGKGSWAWGDRATCLFWGGGIFPRTPRSDGGPYERPVFFEPRAIIPKMGECPWQDMEEDHHVWG